MMTTIRSGAWAMIAFLLFSWILKNRADIQDCMLLLILCYVIENNYRVSRDRKL